MGSSASEFKNFTQQEAARQLGTAPPPKPVLTGVDMYKHAIYEAKLPFVLRFMVDCNIVGCNWLEVKAGSYRLLDSHEKVSEG